METFNFTVFELFGLILLADLLLCTSPALQVGLSRESLYWCLCIFQLSKDFLIGKGPIFPEEPLTEKFTDADGLGKHRASCSVLLEDLDGGKVQEDILQRQDTGVNTILEVEQELFSEKCRDEQREDGHEEVPLIRRSKRKLLPSQQESKNENHGNPKEGNGGNKSLKSSIGPLTNIDSPAKRLRKRDDSGRVITKGSPSRGDVLTQGESELSKQCPTVVTDEEVGTIFKDLDSKPKSRDGLHAPERSRPDQSKLSHEASRGNEYIARSDVDSDAETQVYVDQKPGRLLLLLLL